MKRTSMAPKIADGAPRRSAAPTPEEDREKAAQMAAFGAAIVAWLTGARGPAACGGPEDDNEG